MDLDQTLPVIVNATSSPKNIELGKPLVITCEAVSVPVPKYRIIHNGTKIVSTTMTYNVAAMTYNHAGSYQCIAENILGKTSKTISLLVLGKTKK